MHKVRAIYCGLIGALAVLGAAQETRIDAVTFADEPGVTYVPIKELGFKLGWEMTSDADGFYVNGMPVETPRTLFDGTRLVRVRNLTQFEAIIGDVVAGEVPLSIAGQSFIVRIGEKRVVVNKAEQRLRGYQGDRLIIDTRVSTGRRGYTTPNGTWAAGPEKAKMRYSRKYDNSPMPWAIQISGGYFMHGYPSVPKRPASHGCVRLLLREGNPAKWIWHWVDLGTPITIANDWAGVPATVASKKSTDSETIPVGDN